MSKCTAEYSNLKRCKTKSGEMFILLDIFCLNSTCLLAQEPEKEMAPAASVKKQPPVQENAAAVQPVKAAVEVSGLTGKRESKMILKNAAILFSDP